MVSFFKDVYVESLEPEWMRLPLWRWQQATRFMADPTDDSYEFENDPYLREAATLMHCRACREPGIDLQMLGNPALVNACQIYNHINQHGGARWQVEALMLGGASNEVLNEKFPTRGGERTYQYFRKLFFDIEDYRDNKHAILSNVISVAMSRHDTYSDHDLPWKVLGYSLGWEKFSDFLDHYTGGSGSRELRKFLQEFQEMRMMYYMYTQVLDMRTAFQERSLALFETSLKHYKIPEDKVNSIMTEGALESCKKLLSAVQTTCTTAERIELGAIEGIRSSGRSLQLKPQDRKELEAIYEVVTA